MAEKKPTITLAMIVKDEEKGLKEAIQSCREHVDEIIISVDSKSTDNTLKVAQELAGTTIIHKWNNSFSEARNGILPLVRTDWILWLDGHESVKEWANLKDLLNNPVDAIFVKIILENNFTFFFPRVTRKNIKWQHAIHNTPITKTTIKCDTFIITHDRPRLQSKEAIEQRNAQRKDMVLGLMGNIIKKNKKDARALFYTAQQYLETEKFKTAVKYYKKCLKYSKIKPQRWIACYNASLCYNELGKHTKALYYLLQAEIEEPNRWEITKMIGITYAFIGWWEKAAKNLVDSFKVNTGTFMFNPAVRNDAQTWDYLGICFTQMEQQHKAQVAWRRALEINKQSETPLLSMERARLLETLLGQTPGHTEPKTPIEVCFLVYQRPERVPKILEQLKIQTIQNFKVNIWNNSGQELDTSNFPQDRIKVINSKKNIGSQARFRLAKQTTGNPIIFFDDDEDLSPNFIEYNYTEHLKFGKNIILGWFTRTFNKESYWKSLGAKYTEEVDYIATKAMILDREIIDNEPLLQNIPKDFAKVEDLYLCYLARMKHDMALIKIDRTTTSFIDNKDQWSGIDKETAFKKLRKMGWWILKDNIDILQGLKFKVRNEQWDRNILWGELRQNVYQIPDKPKIVVDIGAHIGGTAILCASKGAEVFAYEPQKENFTRLKENIKLNKLENKIHCFRNAVGDPGNRTLYDNDKNSGMASFSHLTKLPELVESVSIKEVFKKISHCDLLKIDCEGAEYEFIKDIPFDKIDQISMELHKGKQQEAIDLLKQHYAVKYKKALDQTSKMVICKSKTI